MRSDLESRPLLILCSGLIIGLTAVRYPINLVALGALLFILAGLRSRALVTAAFVAGCLLAPPLVPQLRQQTWTDRVATVVTMPRLYPDYSSSEIDFGEARMLLMTPLHTRLSLGDRIRVRGQAKPFSEGQDAFAATRGLIGQIRPKHVEVIEEGPALYRLAESWRDGFVRYCDERLDPKAAAFVDALCFNADGGLDQATKQALQRTGTAHIVAASGLHVVLLAAMVAALLSMLPIPRPVQLGLLTAVLATYAIAAGLQPAIVRAVVMSIVALTAYLWRREADGLSALSLAALLYLLWRPGTVYEVGFQLSFVVVAGLMLFSGGRSRKSGWLSSVRHRAEQGAVAAGVSAPLTAYAFGIVSLVSVPANLLVALALPVLMLAALGAHAVSGFWPALGAGLMALVAPLAAWTSGVVDFFNRPLASASVPAFSGYWVALIYACLLLAWRPRVRRA